MEYNAVRLSEWLLRMNHKDESDVASFPWKNLDILKTPEKPGDEATADAHGVQYYALNFVSTLRSADCQLH